MEEIFNSELGRKIMALTKAGFKVSDLISDLILREKIKHQVLEVYKTFCASEAAKNYFGLLKEIDVLDGLFYLGGNLNLIKNEHLKQLRNGILVFKSHIILALNNNTNNANKNARITRIENDEPKHNIDDLSAKQKKILEKFESKNTLKLAEVMEIFPDISERTIRNELASLIDLGKITRDGRGNGSFYRLTIDSKNR